jgi:hypothetical protein
MKLYIPAVSAAIAIALTGCGGGEKPVSSTTAAKATSTATARAKVPDLVGKTFLEAKSELGKINYYASVYGPDGVKWSSETVPDETVLTVSTAPAAGGVSGNATVNVKVNVTEEEFLAGAKAKHEADAVAEAEATIATRYTYTCGNSTNYKSLKEVWASGDYKFGGTCAVDGGYTLLPSEQKLVDVVASKGVNVTNPSRTVERIMGLCAKLETTYADLPTIPERKGEAEAALTVCPHAPHAAALQEVATLSKIIDGNMTVGKTMEPGTWKTKPGVKDCYWSRSTGGGDIIENDIVDFAPDGVVVTVLPGEGFKSSRCGTWTKIG